MKKNFKEWWKKLKGWQKGGIIGALVCTIIFLTSGFVFSSCLANRIVEYPSRPWGAVYTSFSCALEYGWGIFLGVFPFAIIIMVFNIVLPFPFGLFVGILDAIITGFITGALIGLIIQKIKKK